MNATETVLADKPRNAYIDHIRVFLTMLVVLHHAAITYGAPGQWFCKEVQTDSLSAGTRALMTLFVAVNQAYFMGFFFLLAGYFTPSSFDRKGGAAFLKDRLLRLGLPLLVYVTLVVPITIGLAGQMMNYHVIGGFYHVYVHGHYEPGPLWFVQTLLVFALAYALWRRVRHAAARAEEPAERPLPSHFAILLTVLAVGGASFLIRTVLPVGISRWGIQPGFFASYIALFPIGCLAARGRWLERVSLRMALPWMLAAALAVLVFMPALAKCPSIQLLIGGWNVYALFWAMWEPIVAAGAILGLLWIGRTLFCGTNAFMQALSRASYATYIAHATVLVGVSVLFMPLEAAPIPKFLMVGASSVALSFLVGWLLTKIPGLRRVI